MAGASLLALLDDITALLDDVALMTKTAASKTAAVLGDDLAVNAEQVTGVNAERELPIVWAVAKGSLVNKCIIVPIAMLLSLVAPWAILPLLLFGGLYLCYEGAEKLFAQHSSKQEQSSLETVSIGDEQQKITTFEQEKIKGAIRTDFVLSIEIVVITLGTVAEENLQTQFIVLAIIAFAATVGVYGIVAMIVKLDDVGLYFIRQTTQKRQPTFFDKVLNISGNILVNLAPRLMKALTVVGTIAMFLVGGGIISHAIHMVFAWTMKITTYVSELFVAIDWLVSLSNSLTPLLLNGFIGMFAGTVLFYLPKLVKQLQI